MSRLASTFSSLRVRNYRIFFSTQLVSVTGTWMQSTAQMWLVLRLTHSGLALGVTAALQFTPMLLFGTWGGLFADRADKRKLLIGTQAAAAIVALALAVATLTGAVQLWMVYLLALLLGFVNAVDNPTRQSFVTEMVGARQIINAVSLNSAVFTSARVVGPALAGLLIAVVGTGWCFLANGLSYLPVIVGLILMRPSELHRGAPVAAARGQIKAGLRYAWTRPELRLPLLLMLAVGTLAFNFSVLLPLLAHYTFHSGAGTFGVFLSLMGAGSFAGALLAAGRKRPTHRLLALSALAFGILLVGVALMPALGLEMLVLVPLGLAMITFQATGNSLLQLNSEPAFRGRVMALYVIVFLGSTPIGAPTVGWVAQTFGPRAAFGLGGVATIVGALLALVAVSRWRLGERRGARVGPGPGVGPEVTSRAST
ncbi:MAG: MFS transporter [Candidatus Dormibacteraceae bacterium]